MRTSRHVHPATRARTTQFNDYDCVDDAVGWHKMGSSFLPQTKFTVNYQPPCLDTMKPIAAKLLFLITIICLGNCSSICAKETFLMVLRDHSVLSVELQNESINWQQVGADGSLSINAVPLSQIRSLEFSQRPANEEVALVMASLNRLDSSDYYVREAAEQELKKSEMVVKYRALIEQRLNQAKSFDARYRIQRILKKFSKRAETKPPEFDKIQFADGQLLRGDARISKLKCNFRGKLLELDRSLVKKVVRPETIAIPRLNRMPLNAVDHFDPKSDVVQQLMQLPIRLDFERDGNGLPLAIGQSIETAFADRGVLFEPPTAKPSYVGVATFGMRQWVADIPCQGNAIAVFSLRAKKFRPFQGDMTIRFCVPGRPDAPAGVLKFGAWLAKCNHFRDFVMEAYNADDQIVATTEASSRPAVYLGVTSSELITRIEIKSNPYLEHSEGHSPSSRIIDTNYAMDDVTFSPPQPVHATTHHPVLPGLNDEAERTTELLEEAVARKFRLQTEQGDVIWTNNLRWQADGALLGLPGSDETIQIVYDEIVSCQLSSPPVWDSSKDQRARVKDASLWHAVLADRSVVKVDVENGFSNEWGVPLKESDIDGLLPVFGPARLAAEAYPQTALVFPTCTILAKDLDFSNGKISWTRTELLENDLILPEDVDDVDPTQPHPISDSLEMLDTYASQLPSIWFRQPKTMTAGDGQLVLSDNQRIVLGTGFAKFKSISDDGVTIQIGGMEKTIPWDRVVAFRLRK